MVVRLHCRRPTRNLCDRPGCRARGRPIRSLRRAPPQERSRLPSASNSRTGGADTQHFDRGGVSAAAFSSSVGERGRWTIQMWSCSSTATPPTCPTIQLFGNGFGQDASTAKVGISPAAAGADRPISGNDAMQAEKNNLDNLERARLSVGVMGASRRFFLAVVPLGGSQSWEATKSIIVARIAGEAHGDAWIVLSPSLLAMASARIARPVRVRYLAAISGSEAGCMRRWLGGMTAFLLSLCATVGAAATPVDCGPVPSVKCLASAIFSLAKTLPEDDGFRRHVAFAERELAHGDLKVALEYVVGELRTPRRGKISSGWRVRDGSIGPSSKPNNGHHRSSVLAGCSRLPDNFWTRTMRCARKRSSRGSSASCLQCRSPTTIWTQAHSVLSRERSTRRPWATRARGATDKRHQ